MLIGWSIHGTPSNQDVLGASALASVLTASRRVTAADHQKHRGVIEGRLRRTRVLFRCVPAAHGQYF